MAFSLLCALVGLGAAVLLIKKVLRSPAGNERMREVADAIQEGAKAYLRRQILTIGAIAIVILILLAMLRDLPTAMGFLLGAICSLSAGAALCSGSMVHPPLDDGCGPGSAGGT